MKYDGFHIKESLYRLLQESLWRICLPSTLLLALYRFFPSSRPSLFWVLARWSSPLRQSDETFSKRFFGYTFMVSYTHGINASSRPEMLLDEALAPLCPGTVVLVEDCVETSGAFVFHHLIKRALSSVAGTVVLVGLSNSFFHYDRILRKLGCNLTMQREHNRFFYFDMLMLDSSGGGGRNINEGGLVDLYGKIQKAIETSASSGPSKGSITIMIDDISLLEAAAHGSVDLVLDFLHYCHTLFSELDCLLVLLSHVDIYSSMVAPTLILSIKYLADIVIKAEPLATGLATDVHGQLTVVNKAILNNLDYSSMWIGNFHFKVKENIVEYFYPGSHT